MPGRVRYTPGVRSKVAIAACILFASAGCDESISLFSHRDAAENTRSLGVVSLSRSVAIETGVAAEVERFAIDARFVRFDAAYEADTRAILGLSDLENLPDLDACGPLGANRRAPEADAGTLPPGGAGVELLDVGRIRVGGAERSQYLAVRTFPDLLDVVSGVTYGGVADVPYRAGAAYEVRGDRDRTPWVTVVAPPDWTDLRANGLAVADGLAGALDAGRALELRWTPWTERSSDVVAAFTWTGPDGAPQGFVCHPADDGAFDLPADAAGRLPAAPDLAGLTMRVERFSRVSFQMDRVDEAEAIFRVAVTVPVR